MQVRSLGQEDPLEKETHSSILAWEIPWTEGPHGLQSTGSQRVRRDWMSTGTGLAGWQGYGSFRWTLEGSSHTYACIRPPPHSPPIQAVTENWAEFLKGNLNMAFFSFLDMIMLSVGGIDLNTRNLRCTFQPFLCRLPLPTCTAGRKDSDRHVHPGLLLNIESLQVRQLQRQTRAGVWCRQWKHLEGTGVCVLIVQTEEWLLEKLQANLSTVQTSWCVQWMALLRESVYFKSCLFFFLNKNNSTQYLHVIRGSVQGQIIMNGLLATQMSRMKFENHVRCDVIICCEGLSPSCIWQMLSEPLPHHGDIRIEPPLTS